MLLYHGSNIIVSSPKLIPSHRLLDFGPGFYLTSDLEQARKWALRVTKIRQTGVATVSVFDFYEDRSEDVKVLAFEHPDKTWLEFVCANRLGRASGDEYDIVSGPVANDQTIRTLNDYMEGRFSADIALQLLRAEKLSDQYAFKTLNALKLLSYKEMLT